MKHLLIALSLLVLIAGCSSPSADTMTLTGEIKGLKKGTLFLQKLNDSALVTIDSMVVDGNASFTFSEEVISPEIYYLAVTFKDSSGVIKRIPFFAEPTAVSVTSTLENYENDAVVKGSINQEKLDVYASLMERYTNKNLDLIEENLNALKDGNDSLNIELQSKQEKLLMGKYLATVNYALNESEYEIAPYLMLSQVYDANIKYLDTVYAVLTPKVKDSKYGKALESFIKERKE